MKILLLNQFFWPDAAPTAQLLGDVARDLAERGHEVTVLCGSSAYSAGKSAEPAPPVNIVRTPAAPFAHGRIAKLLSYASFFAGALIRTLRMSRPDVVLCLTTPPFLAVLGWLIRKLRGARYYIWEMDLYPEVAVDLGFLKPKSGLTRALLAMSRAVRSHADGVIALGPCMRERLIRSGVPEHKIFVAENWAHSSGARGELPAAELPLEILYAGNLGLAHDVDTISAAMLRLKSDRRFHFQFAGGGPRRAALERFCRDNEIDSLSFHSYLEPGEFYRNLSACALGLVTQSEACFGSVVPSKVYGLMAASRPILYIGPRDTTPGRIVRAFRCGWQVDCGDVDSVVNLLWLLAAQPDALSAAGARGRKAFLENYDVLIGVARLAAILGAATEPVYESGFAEPSSISKF